MALSPNTILDYAKRPNRRGNSIAMYVFAMLELIVSYFIGVGEPIQHRFYADTLVFYACMAPTFFHALMLLVFPNYVSRIFFALVILSQAIPMVFGFVLMWRCVIIGDRGEAAQWDALRGAAAVVICGIAMLISTLAFVLANARQRSRSVK